MKNEESLVVVKENVFTKIKKFFKNIFKKKNIGAKVEQITNKDKIQETNTIEKQEFFELYEKAKNQDIDLWSLKPDILAKMCILIEEEVNIKKSKLEEIKQKINM